MQPPFEIGRHIDFAIAALEQSADIATLEQESRQMRARMERLEYLINKTYYIGDDGNIRQVLMDNLLADVALDILQDLAN